MALYFLIDQNDRFLKAETADEKPADPTGKGWRWVESGDTEFDALLPSYILPRKADALLQTYADVDAIVEAAIGKRGQEYLEAEAAARAYQDAGFTGSVSAYVSQFALYNPTGETQTNQWAAEQIIARADAMRTVQLSMRSQRFETQAAIRNATDDADLSVAMATWATFVTATRIALGI